MHGDTKLARAIFIGSLIGFALSIWLVSHYGNGWGLLTAACGCFLVGYIGLDARGFMRATLAAAETTMPKAYRTFGRAADRIYGVVKNLPATYRWLRVPRPHLDLNLGLLLVVWAGVEVSCIAEAMSQASTVIQGIWTILFWQRWVVGVTVLAAALLGILWVMDFVMTWPILGNNRSKFEGWSRELGFYPCTIYYPNEDPLRTDPVVQLWMALQWGHPMAWRSYLLIRLDILLATGSVVKESATALKNFALVLLKKVHSYERVACGLYVTAGGVGGYIATLQAAPNPSLVMLAVGALTSASIMAWVGYIANKALTAVTDPQTAPMPQ